MSTRSILMTTGFMFYRTTPATHACLNWGNCHCAENGTVDAQTGTGILRVVVQEQDKGVQEEK